jgi:hypothetical protein
MPILEKEIRSIGADLVRCNERCAGIHHDIEEGILPRCLLFERAGRNERGCFSAGINPGRSRRRERAFYMQTGARYDALIDFWDKEIKDVPYYRRLRQLVNAMGISGPIIWSDLAKCENAPDVEGLIPLQTLRTCSGRFLRRELEIVPADWPVIAVGTEAYKALAYLEPRRTVIGVPHPTGSRGNYFALFENSGLKSNVARHAKMALESEVPIAIWLAVDV